MTQVIYTSSDDVLLALVGSDQDAEAAISHVHHVYGESLTRHLNRRAPWLSVEDKADVLQDVYVRLWKKGRDGTLNIDVGLAPLLMTMAFNFAVDVLRGRNREKEHLSSDAYRHLCEDAIHGTSIGEQLRHLESLKKATAMFAAFKTWLQSLPRKQMEVAYVLADCAQAIMDETKAFPSRIGSTVVYEEMLQRGLQPTSAMAVKRALQEIRDKFAEYLKANDSLRTLR